MASLQFFELIQIADMISQMVDVYYRQDIKCWIDESDFLSEIVMEKKAFMRLIDDQVAIGMDKSIQVLVDQVDLIMLRDSVAADYNPADGQFNLDVKPTKACLKITACIDAHTKILSEVADKNVIEVFYSEIAIRLFKYI